MYFIKTERVAECLDKLRHLNVHRSVIGYLCVKKYSTEQSSITAIKPNFKEFHDTYLTTSDSTKDKPYIHPFEPSDAKIWTNPNVAGSYTPSSIRPENPLLKAIEINGKRSQALYSLQEKHWEKAKEFILNNGKIPVICLICFLYRDYGFNIDNIDLNDLIDLFKEEFGYENKIEFNEIFEYSDEDDSGDWFEYVEQ